MSVECSIVVIPLHIGLFIVNTIELGFARGKVLWIVDPRPRKGSLTNSRGWAKVSMEPAGSEAERQRAGRREYVIFAQPAESRSKLQHADNVAQQAIASRRAAPLITVNLGGRQEAAVVTAGVVEEAAVVATGAPEAVGVAQGAGLRSPPQAP